MPVVSGTSISPVFGGNVVSATIPPDFFYLRTGASTSTSTYIATNSTTSTGLNTVVYYDSGTGLIASSVISGRTIATVYTGTSIASNIFIPNETGTGYHQIISGTTVHNYQYKPPKIDYRQRRIKRDYARKALFKSVRLFENLFGINQIKLFLNGEAFEIEGRIFNYRISKSNYGILEHTANPNSHVIPYKLEVYNKQGLQLFNGCTIFKNTPIIDQITALMLHINSGEEEQVLKNMNISKMTEHFYQDVDSIEVINRIQNKNIVPR